MTGHKTYELGDVTLQSGAVLKNAQLAYATYGTLNAAADNAVLLADILYRHASPQRSSVRTGARHRSRAPFRGFGQSVRQRLLVIAEQFERAAGRPALSARDAVRQCRLPAPPAHRASRRSADRARPRLVARRDAGLSMGGAISRHGRRRSFPIAAPRAARPSTTRFSTARRPRCRPMPPGTTAIIQLRRKRACAPSAASTSPGPTPTTSFATASIASSASPRWRISCATGRRII